MSRRPLAWALLPWPLLALGLCLVILGHRWQSPGLVGAALLLMLVAAPAGLLVALRVALLAACDLERSTRGLLPRELVRGALGVPYLVRGRLGGCAVQVARGRVGVEVEAPSLQLGQAALERIACGVGVRLPAAAAASLLSAGVTGLSCGGGRLTLLGRVVDAAGAVRAALELVRAQAGVHVAGRGASADCPYCRGELLRTEGALRCPACDVRQHGECWRAHGGCAVHGCRRAPRREPWALTSPAPEPGAVPAGWESTPAACAPSPDCTPTTRPAPRAPCRG